MDVLETLHKKPGIREQERGKKPLPPRGILTAPVTSLSPAEEPEALWWEAFGELPEEPETNVANHDIDDLMTENETLNLQSLLELPEHILLLIQALKNPEFNYQEIDYLLSHSPILAGELLKLANSSLYSRGIVVRSIHDALPRLGGRLIRGVVYFNATLINLSVRPNVRTVAKNVVEHSQVVGDIAGRLSKRYRIETDNAFIAGLLHDIGKVVVLKRLSDRRDLDSSLSEDDCQCYFDRYHALFGVLIGEHWGLSPEIISAIRYHHDFTLIPRADDVPGAVRLTALIQFSDLIARMLGYGRAVRSRQHLFEHPACTTFGIEDNESNRNFFQDLKSSVTGTISGE